VVPYTDTFSSAATAAPYPSNIIVSNLPGTLSALSVQLNLESDFNDIQNVAALLTGPTGANIDFFSNVGGFGSSSSSVTYNIFDGAGSPFGQNTTSDFPPSGNYPTESYGNTSNGASDTYPACPALISNCNGSTPVGPPAPTSGYNYAAPKGSSTFSSIFGSGGSNTYNANGTWSLYLESDTSNDALGTIGSWCVALTENAATVSVAESHSGSGASGGFVQGETGAQITTVVTNNGPGSTGDPRDQPADRERYAELGLHLHRIHGFRLDVQHAPPNNGDLHQRQRGCRRQRLSDADAQRQRFRLGWLAD
jgi:hypothetical protein